MCRASAIPVSGAGTLNMCSQRTEWFPAILLAALVGACGILGPDTPEPTWTSLGLDGEAVRSLKPRGASTRAPTPPASSCATRPQALGSKLASPMRA